MSLLEILRPSPLLKVQELTMNVTKPSYLFPTVVPQHSEDQVVLTVREIKKSKNYIKKKKILKLHPFLQCSMKNTCQADKAACGPKRNGSCAFPSNVCWEKQCRRHPHQGEGKEEICFKFPPVYSKNEQGCLRGRCRQQLHHLEAARALTATEMKVQKEEGERRDKFI